MGDDSRAGSPSAVGEALLDHLQGLALSTRTLTMIDQYTYETLFAIT
jgi:hypothetical protein